MKESFFEKKILSNLWYILMLKLDFVVIDDEVDNPELVVSLGSI